jgi:hypothetical protein
MDKLLELIARIGTDDPPTEAELTKARAELVELLKVATATETRDLENAIALRGAIDGIDAEFKARNEAAEKEEAEAKRLLEGLEEPKEEAEVTEEVEEEKELEAVAASTSLRTAIRSTRARMSTEEPEGPAHTKIITLGAAQGETLNQNATIWDVATVFDRSVNRVKSRGDRQSLVRVEYDYPEERRLFGTDRGDNDRLIDGLIKPQALTAAGGICDPLPADFTHPFLGQRGRPIRDALPRFQASRGGVRFSPAATLAAMSGSVGVWTHTVDTSPGEAEKACLTLTCEDESTAYVDAITACLQIGNFSARFNPEFWRSRLDLLMVAHDRLAEQTLYANLDAASVQVTYGAGNGTIYSVLGAMDKAASGLRSRLRLGNTLIRALAPEWVKAALRADIASQRLGSSPAEALAAADAVIQNFFTVRGISPIWTQDVDLFAAQTTGALQDWPGSNTEIIVFPEGTFFFLDGGTLDLGTEIVDSTLLKTNDRMAFLETFEKGVFRGGQSLAITVPIDEVCVCPDVAVLTSA